MVAEADSMSQPKQPAKRRMRNYLLDRRFQLKYTGMVVAVTVVVAGILGYFAYQKSTDLTQAVTMNELALTMHEDAQRKLIEESEAADRSILMSILGGIAVLALTLGVTGIVVTHRVVGPAYKLRRLLREVADGRLKVEGRLRRGDELQEVFTSFSEMVDALREHQSEQIAKLDEAIATARESGVDDEKLQPFQEVREHMQSRIE